MIIYVVIIALAILASVGLTILTKQKKKRGLKKSPYMDALHLLLDGKKDEALEKLKKTVKENTENIMAYIKLGDVFREMGYAIRAAKVHRNLLVRGDLTNDEIDTVLRSLVHDYQAAEKLDKAIEMAERLVHRRKKDVDTQRTLLSLYEQKGDWDKAFFYRQSLNKWLKKRDQTILALYKVQSGLRLVQQGTERESRIRFREAIKLDKKCIPAYLYLGDSYRREGRNSDAYDVWREFTLKNPEWAQLAFNRLREVLFDLGRYGDIEEIYKDVISKKPKDPTVYLNLIEIYKKQGKLNQAVEVCQQIIETHPDSARCRYALVKLLQQRGEESTALQEALQILDREMKQQTTLHCAECGFETPEPLWFCPRCHQWNTFLTETNR